MVGGSKMLIYPLSFLINIAVYRRKRTVIKIIGDGTKLKAE